MIESKKIGFVPVSLRIHIHACIYLAESGLILKLGFSDCIWSRCPINVSKWPLINSWNIWARTSFRVSSFPLTDVPFRSYAFWLVLRVEYAVFICWTK